METEQRQRGLEEVPGQYTDEGIAKLINFLVRRGCHTFASCQDEDGRAYIGFCDGQSLLTAVQEIAAVAHDAQDTPLLCRVLKTTSLPNSELVVPWEDVWRYELQPQWREALGFGSPRRPKLDLYVRFPTSDLALITAYLGHCPPAAVESHAPILPDRCDGLTETWLHRG
jgi:hypothetical protein